jgi:hypothetical protein
MRSATRPRGAPGGYGSCSHQANGQWVLGGSGNGLQQTAENRSERVRFTAPTSMVGAQVHEMLCSYATVGTIVSRA